MSKTDIRNELLLKRKNIDKIAKREMDLEIQSRLLMTDEYRECKTVLVYVSKENEIDTFGIINAAFANNKRVAVPVTCDDYSLDFYQINSIKELKLGKFNVMEPSDLNDKVTDFSDSICIVPALCCDLSGNRVGYGKGCYDRFLAKYPGKKICLVYSDFVFPSVEHNKFDVPVDTIVCNLFVKHT